MSDLDDRYGRNYYQHMVDKATEFWDKLEDIHEIVDLLLGDNPEKLTRYWIYEKIKEIKKLSEIEEDWAESE